MSIIEIQIPDIGDFDEVTVIELLVKPGDTVKAEQSLITVESDKASMEIPSSSAGVVKELKVKLGDKVKQGSVVLSLEATGSSKPAPEAAQVAQSLERNTSQDVIYIDKFAINSVVSRIEVKVPDIGDFKDVAVIEVFVKPGDMIKMEQSLITVESDKAAMEIPSSAAGVLKELKVKVGDKVNIGDLLAILEGAAPVGATASNAVSVSEQKVPVASQSSTLIAPVSVASSASASFASPAHNPAVAPTGSLPHASPSVRKFARELGVPLDEVKGTGPKGRILESDIQSFTQAVMSGSLATKAIAASPVKSASGGDSGASLGLIAWPKVDFAKFGPIERKEMSRIKKISGQNLTRNAILIPAVTNHDDADITELEAFRVQLNKENEKAGIKVTMLAFLIKACVSALKKFPDFNSSLDGDALIYKSYWNIGFAADTPNGLVVPVLKDADKKGVLQISQEMGELAKKAREGKLTPAEMSGACFTISSLGGIGGRYFTPIINAPEVAILGVCKSQMEPVWDGEKFVPRLMLPLSLTWDHRVIDGAAAARFNAYLGQILGDFRRVLL
jgi:pyruvate dehydrogenase E2 component (dihydrolipoamide acetyltransferase)